MPRVPADVYFVGGWAMLNAISHVACVVLRWNVAELFLGAIWLSVELRWVRVAFHCALALCFAINGLGILRLRPYGFWLEVGGVVVGWISICLWWGWGRHWIAEAHGAAPSGWGLLVLNVLVISLLALWCWSRRAIFIRHQNSIRGEGCG